MSKPIGDVIKESRIKYGFATQKEFADTVGISPATLSRIEKNTQKPTPDTLQQISRHLGNITYGELMKSAGYLVGMDSEHEERLLEMMDENERLDGQIKKILDSLRTLSNFQSDILPLIKGVFSNFYYVVPSSADLDELYLDFIKMDYDDTMKYQIIKNLESLQKKLLPKLGEYTSSLKNLTAIPLFSSIYSAFEGKHDVIEDYIHYPRLKKRQPDFAVKIIDDSMSRSSINRGDIVYMRSASWFEKNDQIVGVHLIKENQSALKRIVHDDELGRFILFSDNNFENTNFRIYDNAKEFKIFGVYAGHFCPEK